MAGRKIFILVDGSGPAKCAVDWYLNEICRDNDEVCPLHCTEYDYNIFLPGAAVDIQAVTQMAKENQDKVELMMNSYMDVLRKRNIKVRTKVVTGKPGEAIIKAAEEEKPNMIIMGSRGLGTFRRTLLGSVSEYVIHHAPAHCALTVIRDS